jgi:hypothetical protein
MVMENKALIQPNYWPVGLRLALDRMACASGKMGKRVANACRSDPPSFLNPRKRTSYVFEYGIQIAWYWLTGNSRFPIWSGGQHSWRKTSPGADGNDLQRNFLDGLRLN